MRSTRSLRPLHCGILFAGCARQLVDDTAAALDLAPDLVTDLADEIAASELAVATRHAALVLRFPLGSVDMAGLLRTVRGPGSASRSAAVVLVASRDWLSAAEVLLGRGANRAVASERAATELPAVLESLLTIAPRQPMRVASRVEVPNGAAHRTMLCQTVNLSETGMLLRTGKLFPLGTSLKFELVLPGAAEPVRGEGRVVRHTVERRERLSGVGINFSTFERDGSHRLLQHLTRQAS